MPRQFSLKSFSSKTCVVASMAALLSAVSYAADPKTPQEWQKARHDHYEHLGEAFKAVRDNSRGTPDFAALQKAADSVQKASVNQAQWFPKGTGPEAGKTRALPEIWAKPTEFTAAQNKFSDASAKLLAAVTAKDAGAVSAAFKETGGTCKNCHDTFRSPEE